jgi:hypothetical protein
MGVAALLSQPSLAPCASPPMQGKIAPPNRFQDYRTGLKGQNPSCAFD